MYGYIYVERQTDRETETERQRETDRQIDRDREWMYLVEFMYLLARQVRVTVGDTGLCCCVPCLSSAIDSFFFCFIYSKFIRYKLGGNRNDNES